MDQLDRGLEVIDKNANTQEHSANENNRCCPKDREAPKREVRTWKRLSKKDCRTQSRQKKDIRLERRNRKRYQNPTCRECRIRFCMNEHSNRGCYEHCRQAEVVHVRTHRPV